MDKKEHKLEDQLCFPLYAASREVMKKYRPFLDEIGLTFTQYMTMLVVWENGEINSKELGDRLFLDSGTFTPVLKSLEAKGYLTRCRCKSDERVLTVRVTDKGNELKAKASDIPDKFTDCVKLTENETELLRGLLNKLLEN